MNIIVSQHSKREAPDMSHTFRVKTIRARRREVRDAWLDWVEKNFNSPVQTAGLSGDYGKLWSPTSNEEEGRFGLFGQRRVPVAYSA